MNDQKTWVVTESQHTAIVTTEEEQGQREMRMRAGTVNAEKVATGRGNSRHVLSGE